MWLLDYGGYWVLEFFFQMCWIIKVASLYNFAVCGCPPWTAYICTCCQLPIPLTLFVHLLYLATVHTDR